MLRLFRLILDEAENDDEKDEVHALRTEEVRGPEKEDGRSEPPVRGEVEAFELIFHAASTEHGTVPHTW